jgi:small-conductance mechanosensitive channel
MNLFNNLIIQLNIFISALSDLMRNFTVQNPLRAVFIVASFLLLIILIFSTKKRFIHKKETKEHIIAKLLPPIIIYFFIYYFYHQDRSSLILMILNSITMFWLLMSLSYLPNMYIKDLSKFKISFIPPLIILGLFFNLISEIILYGLPNIINQTEYLYNSVKIISKIIAVFTLYLYIKTLLRPLIEMFSQRFPILTKLKPLLKYFIIFLILFGSLWIFNVISFGINFFLSIALLLIFISILYYINSNEYTWTEKFFKTKKFDKTEQFLISKKIGLLSFLILASLYYALGYKLLNLYKVTDFLMSIYILNTSLIKISFWQLLSSIWLFITLRTALYLFSRYLRTFEFSSNETLTSHSIETLVFNLGTLVVFVLASAKLGITWQVIIPVAGAIGIGIGVGIQGILNNYISGFILLFSKKVKIGDIIELEGNAGRLIGLETDTVFGKVKSIDTFATTINTFDNVDVAIPNSILISGNIVNYTQDDHVVRVRVPIGVAYNSDVEKVKKIIMEAILESPYVLKSKNNDVWFNEFGDSALNFYALCWVNIKQAKHPRNVRVDLIERVWYKFKENEIEIPFPQQDIWFKNELKIEKSE